MTINEIVFDSQNKEYVKITNGIEIGGKFVPTEAIAARIVSVTNSKLDIGLTYRKVNSEFLSPAKSEGRDTFDLILSDEIKGINFLGRV